MGLARPAELNDYPGPRHVLDLTRELTLTEAQTRQTQAVYEAMHAEAVRLGAELVESEARLEAFFAQGSADASRLQVLVSEAAAAAGRLRAAHLEAHVEMRRILTPDQIVRYHALRGYASGTVGSMSREPLHRHH